MTWAQASTKYKTSYILALSHFTRTQATISKEENRLQKFKEVAKAPTVISYRNWDLKPGM